MRQRGGGRRVLRIQDVSQLRLPGTVPGDGVLLASVAADPRRAPRTAADIANDALRRLGGIVPKSSQAPRKLKRLPRINVAEEGFLFQARLQKLPEPTRNYKFHPTRGWEIDFAWPALHMGIEIHGGVWTGGKHGRGAGIVKDMEKHNALLDLHWRVWTYTPGQVTRGEALQHLAPLVRSASSALLKRSMGDA